MIQQQPPPGGRARTLPPAANYPSLQSARVGSNGGLPQALTQAIQQSFETTYSVRDQTTQNTDAINHMVLYGTWQDRVNTAPTALPDGALWFLTDYKNGVYQVRMDPKMNQLAWFYATGLIWIPSGAPFSAQNLNLGLNDAGLMVASGGSTVVYITVWDGTKAITFG